MKRRATPLALERRLRRRDRSWCRGRCGCARLLFDLERDAAIVRTPLVRIVRVDRLLFPEAFGFEPRGGDTARDEPLHHGLRALIAEALVESISALAVGVTLDED